MKSAQPQYSGRQVDVPVPRIDHCAAASQAPCHSLRPAICAAQSCSSAHCLLAPWLLSPVTALTCHQQMSLCLSPGVGPCFLLLETARYVASVSASRSCHGHTDRPSAAAADLGATRAPDSLLHSLSLSPGTGHRFSVFQRLFAEYLLGVRQLGAGTKQEDKLLAWGISVLVRETIPAAYVVPRGCSEGPQASIRSCNLPLCPPCSGKLLPQLPLPPTHTCLATLAFCERVECFPQCAMSSPGPSAAFRGPGQGRKECGLFVTPVPLCLCFCNSVSPLLPSFPWSHQVRRAKDVLPADKTCWSGAGRGEESAPHQGH